MRPRPESALSYQGTDQMVGDLSKPNDVLTELLRREFPMKEGTVAVLQAAHKLFQTQRSVAFTLKDEPYVLEYQVFTSTETDSLKYLDSLKCQTEIRVRAMKSPENYPYVKLSRLGSELEQGIIALQSRSFDVYNNRTDTCDVYGVIATRLGFEGNGLALGLGLLIHQVIFDVRQRNILPSSVTRMRSIIGDSATAHDKQKTRKNWSTDLALMLGYQPLKDNGRRTSEFYRVL